MKRSLDLKYISRIDADRTHCYYVRVGYGLKEYINKSFSDNCLGGKRKALLTAKKWRNKQIKLLSLKMKLHHAKLKINKKAFGKGYNKTFDPRWEPPRESWRATYWSRIKKRQLSKDFSVNKYGDKRAELLAKQWRKLQVTGEL